MHEHKSFVTSHYDRSQLRNANYHSYSAMSDHSSLDYVLLDSITSFLSHKIHIFKMAMPIENLDCDYKRVFCDRTNSIEIIRKIHKLSWRIYTIIIFQCKIYPFVIIITSATENSSRTYRNLPYLQPNVCTLRVITDGCIVLLKQ